MTFYMIADQLCFCEFMSQQVHTMDYYPQDTWMSSHFLAFYVEIAFNVNTVLQYVI